MPEVNKVTSARRNFLTQHSSQRPWMRCIADWDLRLAYSCCIAQAPRIWLDVLYMLYMLHNTSREQIFKLYMPTKVLKVVLFCACYRCLILCVFTIYCIRWSCRNKTYSGPSKAAAGHGKTFSRGPFGEKILDFFKWHILVYFIFLSDSGAPKRHGARFNLPLTPNLDGLEHNAHSLTY